MPKEGITSGGRHIWVNSRHGLIRKPLKNVQYHNEPLPVPEMPVEFQRVSFDLPWWKRLLNWLKGLW